jgi:hypothetical protein
MPPENSPPLDKQQQAFGLVTAAMLVTSAAMMASHTPGGEQLASAATLLKYGTDLNRCIRREMPAAMLLMITEMIVLTGNSVAGAQWPLQIRGPMLATEALFGNAVHDEKLRDSGTRKYYNARDVNTLPGGLVGEARRICQPAHLRENARDLARLLRQPGDWKKGLYHGARYQ